MREIMYNVGVMVTFAGDEAALGRAGMELCVAAGNSGFGMVYTAESPLGVAFAGLGEPAVADLLRCGFRVSDRPQRQGSLTKLVGYLDEREEIDCALHLLGGTPLMHGIWRALLLIPEGKTVSYGGLAAMAGAPMRHRAAGRAMAHNPLPFFLPCHRVIMADGRLGGYGGREDVKAALLMREGVSFSRCGDYQNWRVK